MSCALSRPIAVIARFAPRPGSRDALRALLKTMVTPTRSEDGCRTYDLYEIADDGGFVLFERYASRRALEAHRASAHYVDYRARVTELLTGPIEVEVLDIVDEAC
nr:putative quinol monooxygenase [Mycobacterium angelicum]